GLKVERAHFCAEPDLTQLGCEFVVSVGPARQQFRTDDDRPAPIELGDRDLNVMLLVPTRRSLPPVDHDGVAAVSADEPVPDVQPGTSSPDKLPGARGEYQAPTTAQKPCHRLQSSKPASRTLCMVQ